MKKLFNNKKLEAYLKDGSRHVDGYLLSGSASIICSIIDIQDELKIYGNIAEIGVYHGKLLILLCHCLRTGESAFAIDVFDTQPSVQGIKTEGDYYRFSSNHLLNNLNANKINKEIVNLIIRNSQDLTSGDLVTEFGGSNIRLFSIDGDHSRAGVRHDLNLAAATLTQGGIILIDDLFNTICPSLTEGIIDFFREDGAGCLEPVAIVAANGPVNSGSSKLIISDSQFAKRYKAYLQLLNRVNYSHSDSFLGYPNVLIFDFKESPTRHILDDNIRNVVEKFFNRGL